MSNWDREKMVADAAAFEYPLSWVYLCTVNAFRALLEEVGLNRTLEATRHYNEAWARANVGMMKEKLGPLENDLELLALGGYYGHSCTSMGHVSPLEIYEGGAIYELYSCPNPSLKAPPEMCIAMSHIFTECGCRAVNPEYEGIYTHHLANGDDCCRLVVKKKTSHYTIDNLGKLVKTIPPPSLSQEEMWAWTMRMVAFSQFFTFTSVLIDLVGSQRAKELVAPFARETGLMIGSQLKGGSLDKGDISMIKEKIEALSPMLMTQGSEVKVTDEGLERKIIDCPCKGASPEVCLHIEGVLNGVCEAINPDYEFVHDQMMSKGDPTCHWTIRKKDMALPANETALEILKKRFAKGEISKEEYLEMKALLE